MKNILLGLLVLSTSAFADVNGSIGYSSDYMWRGATQSAGASSLNAGIELDSNGFFVGAWVGEDTPVFVHIHSLKTALEEFVD